MAFILKRYEVLVVGYNAAFFYAKNKNQARIRAYQSLSSVNDQITFKRFLEICANIVEVRMPKSFGSPIEVDGKPAHWIEYAGGNSVRFAYPDSDVVRLTHESDVRELIPLDYPPNSAAS